MLCVNLFIQKMHIFLPYLVKELFLYKTTAFLPTLITFYCTYSSTQYLRYLPRQVRTCYVSHHPAKFIVQSTSLCTLAVSINLCFSCNFRFGLIFEHFHCGLFSVTSSVIIRFFEFKLLCVSAVLQSGRDKRIAAMLKEKNLPRKKKIYHPKTIK